MIATTPPQLFLLEGQMIFEEYKDCVVEEWWRLVRAWESEGALTVRGSGLRRGREVVLWWEIGVVFNF
jgi:hypothetical protein